MRQKTLGKKSAIALAGIAIVLAAGLTINSQLNSAQATSWFDGAELCQTHTDCQDLSGAATSGFADQQIQSASYYGVCDLNLATNEKICVREVSKINGVDVQNYKLAVTDQLGLIYIFNGSVLGTEPVCITTEDEYPYPSSGWRPACN